MNTVIDVAAPTVVIETSFARELPKLSIPWKPSVVQQPGLAVFNQALARDLGLPQACQTGATAAALWSGQHLPAGCEPVAQAYSGHQFGGYSPRLGDGRALLLGEIRDQQGQLQDLAFKGSGRTPFSRGGDGKAALGPMLREYLMGEAMHALNIPTTRALAVATTGDPVLRDSGPLPGAVLTRVAASHLRVGSFQYAAALDDGQTLQDLLNYALKRHDPQALAHPKPALALLEAVAERQALLLAKWMGVGFIHGVMNTDNMTISGQTIDYGPCAFMDHYDPATVFSSIDYHGRYAYGNQPAIARWNLARLAESLLPLMADDAETAVALATGVIDAFPGRYQHHWLELMRQKLGLLGEAAGSDADDLDLAQGFLTSMQGQGVDYTLAFRWLTRFAQALPGAESQLPRLYEDPAPFFQWFKRWQARFASARPASAAAQAMAAVNPAFIPRNHRVEEALQAAWQRADWAPWHTLMAVLARPFDEQPEAQAHFGEPLQRELSAAHQTFCGT